MDKLDMQSKNLVDENISKIAELFPNCITEGKDENGQVVKLVDFDLLKQELSKDIVEGNDERYTLNWAGKKQAILTANSPINATLRPCREESVDFDNTKNLYIEGDNLDVLKLLRETYLGKVKMIYIDPPYNTGNDFVYEDDFATSAEDYLQASKSYDEQGNRMFQNSDSNGRFHSDWLSMMYSRLKIAKDLLKEDGVLFISIGDDEVDNLKKLCFEIFGERNFISQITWVSKSGGSADEKNIINACEYILVVAKNINEVNLGKKKDVDDNEKYVYSDEFVSERGKYVLKKLDYRMTSAHYTESLNYPIIDPDNNELWPGGEHFRQDGGWNWRWSKSKVEWGFKNNFLVFKKGNNNKWTLSSKQYQFVDNNNNKIDRSMPYTNFVLANDFNTSQGSRLLVDFFGIKIFEYSKPVGLLKLLINIANVNDSEYVLDFFSGSATTAHAVMQLNAEDGGNRKFIMVQLPENCDEKSEAYKAGYKNICEIGKERIKKAGKKIKEELKNFGYERKIEGKTTLSVSQWGSANNFTYKDNNTGEIISESRDVHDKKDIYKYNPELLDIGFRVLKLDSSNMKDIYYRPAELNQASLLDYVSNIKEGRTAEDLLFQVMLDMGVMLSSEIKTIDIKGKKVFNVNDGNLVCCFDNDLTDEVVTEIAKLQPLYAVFRDSSMSSDSVAVNFDQIFETYSPTTTRKVL